MSESSNELKSKVRNILFQTDSFEIVSIEWTNQCFSSLHNHGWSQCLVMIEEGVFENHLDLGAKVEIQILEKGQVVTTPVGAKHEMHCQSPRGKTLHIYTPKIKELDDAGNFRAPDLDPLKRQVALGDPTRFDALKNLLTKLQEQSISTQSPYFMNQLFSGVWPQALLAEDFIAKTKTTLATFEASPAFSTLEEELISSLGERIGWDSSRGGGLAVPGGSAANFMAVHCARQKFCPELKKTGMGSQKFKVFVSSEAHYSFKKACVVLGLGYEAVIAVPCDGLGRMKPESLEVHLQKSKDAGDTPLLVVATAGTTVLGAFDPIEEIAALCRKHGLWLHVDGAWGGPVLFSEKLRPLVRGIQLADSATFDAHKLFGAALTSSFFLTRHSEILLEANDVSGGEYLFHSEVGTLDRGRLSWQCGRGADAVSFWTIWKSLGTAGLGAFVDRLVEIRDEVMPWIREQRRLELVAEPAYLNICVRVLPPAGAPIKDWSTKVRERLKNQNQAMVNFSSNGDGSFLRLILAHPYLQADHVRQILQWALEVK